MEHLFRVNPSPDIKLETKTEKEYLGNRRFLFSSICGDAMPPINFNIPCYEGFIQTVINDGIVATRIRSKHLKNSSMHENIF